jgi:hypothetical protein
MFMPKIVVSLNTRYFTDFFVLFHRGPFVARGFDDRSHLRVTFSRGMSW